VSLADSPPACLSCKVSRKRSVSRFNRRADFLFFITIHPCEGLTPNDYPRRRSKATCGSTLIKQFHNGADHDTGYSPTEQGDTLPNKAKGRSIEGFVETRWSTMLALRGTVTLDSSQVVFYNSNLATCAET